MGSISPLWLLVRFIMFNLRWKLQTHRDMRCKIWQHLPTLTVFAIEYVRGTTSKVAKTYITKLGNLSPTLTVCGIGYVCAPDSKVAKSRIIQLCSISTTLTLCAIKCFKGPNSRSHENMRCKIGQHLPHLAGCTV